MTTTDLIKLKDVSEGWYVDYKESPLTINKISKQLSSFANQYGGWLFFGIRESQDRKAGEYVGVPTEETEDLLVKIREAATTHVSPYVYYLYKVIDGPSEEIGLEEGRSIVAIYTPEGPRTPYIDACGKIYRRLSDQSIPTPETDRHVLDMLWRKGKNKEKRLKKFIKKRRHTDSKNTPKIYAHILTNPSFEKQFKHIPYEKFRKILTGSKDKLSIPMDSIHSTLGGFIAKQTIGNNPLGELLTLRWWHNGNTIISIPLNKTSPQDIENHTFNYDNLDSFAAEVSKQGYGDALICDLNYFFLTLSALLNQLHEIYKETQNKEKIKVSISIENAAGMIPFVDEPSYIDHIKEQGPPTIEDNKINIPFKPHEHGLFEIEIYDENSHIEAPRDYWPLLSITPLASALLYSTGVIRNLEEIAEMTCMFKAPQSKLRGKT